uniref:Uncharacterized protein n=1 Tax=Arion vulgaris TaxID=1028688 RepID=A0A0B6Z6V2_9EUPU
MRLYFFISYEKQIYLQSATQSVMQSVSHAGDIFLIFLKIQRYRQTNRQQLYESTANSFYRNDDIYVHA